MKIVKKKENNPFYGKRHTLKSLNLIKSAAKKTNKQQKQKQNKSTYFKYAVLRGINYRIRN